MPEYWERVRGVYITERILPIARASIVAGVSLVILEVLNDYGVVKYYGTKHLQRLFSKRGLG